MDVSHSTQWLDTLVKSLSTPQRSPLGDTLPAYSDEQLQRNTTGLSSEAALQQAHAFYENVRDGLPLAGLEIGEASTALDFGFGWGCISSPASPSRRAGMKRPVSTWCSPFRCSRTCLKARPWRGSPSSNASSGPAACWPSPRAMSPSYVAGYFDGTKYDQACFVLRKPA